MLSKPQKDKLNLKSKIINLLSKIKILNKYFSGIGTILMLHRVSDFETNKIFPNENIKTFWFVKKYKFKSFTKISW